MSEFKTPAEIIAEKMGLGFNLGNSFDAVGRPGSQYTGVDSELAWFNPKTTREMITAIRKAGFKTLRLPVTWHNHVISPDKPDTYNKAAGDGQNPDVTKVNDKSSGILSAGDTTSDRIDPAWMARIREVVDWCVDEDLYVILNTHHDIWEGFLLPDNAHIDRACEFLRNVWEQIAAAFRDVTADRLLFESMNEIRIPMAPYEWTPDYDDPDCVAAMRNVNRLNQLFVDTVRAAGGENERRCLVIPGYSTSTEGVCWDGFELPRDGVSGSMIVAAHMYSPAHFAFYLKEGANIINFDPDDPASTGPIDERLNKLCDKFVKKGIPVNVDEFGTVDKDNDEDRIRCLEYTLKKASELGIRCCYWDNGVFKGYGNGMAIFDRKKCEFPDMRPVEVMLKGF
ncbi:MAG: glycoside hydrolase family 5 protein [Lachnospiraceae bacterium]|nr:glycoside hydrolase family 5 protein [Lachnospiraceae bacterium]